MKALVLHRHGGMEQLVLEQDWPRPVPAAGEVLVRVRASSLNRHDIFTRNGLPGVKLTLPLILGCDIAGEIEAVGTGLAAFAPGDRVLLDPLRPGRGLMGEIVDGGLAEFCIADARQLIRLPPGVSFEAAAALPVAYGAAHRLMLTNGAIRAGERIMILAAGSGVGTCCVLLAKLAGCEVIAAARTADKLARLKALDVDHVVDTSTTDFVRWVHDTFGKPHRRHYEGGVNVMVNYTGGDTWVPSLRALRRGGRLLICGATAGYDPKEDLRYVWSNELRIIGSNAWERTDLEQLVALCADGRLTPVIDRVVPLAEARDALRALENNKVFGKIAVTP